VNDCLKRKTRKVRRYIMNRGQTGGSALVRGDNTDCGFNRFPRWEEACGRGNCTI